MHTKILLIRAVGPSGIGNVWKFNESGLQLVFIAQANLTSQNYEIIEY